MNELLGRDLLDKSLDHEHIEVCSGVLAKRAARLEPIPPVQRMCRLEGYACASLETQVSVSTLSSRTNDFIKNCLSDAASEKGSLRTH